MNNSPIILKLVGNLLNIQTEGEYITIAELKTIDKNYMQQCIAFLGIELV